MVLFDDSKIGEDDSGEEKGPNWAGVIIGVALLPVWFFFDSIGKEKLGTQVCICIAANAAVVVTSKKSRGSLWFWCVIAFIVALHVPIILFVPWPDTQVNRFSIMLIACADCAIISGIIRFIEHFIVKEPSSEEDE